MFESVDHNSPLQGQWAMRALSAGKHVSSLKAFPACPSCTCCGSTALWLGNFRRTGLLGACSVYIYVSIWVISINALKHRPFDSILIIIAGACWKAFWSKCQRNQVHTSSSFITLCCPCSSEWLDKVAVGHTCVKWSLVDPPLPCSKIRCRMVETSNWYLPLDTCCLFSHAGKCRNWLCQKGWYVERPSTTGRNVWLQESSVVDSSPSESIWWRLRKWHVLTHHLQRAPSSGSPKAAHPRQP